MQATEKTTNNESIFDIAGKTIKQVREISRTESEVGRSADMPIDTTFAGGSATKIIELTFTDGSVFEI